MSLIISAVVFFYFIFLIWRGGSALVHGRELASVAVGHFHEQLNAEEYETIYRNADDGFKAGQSHDEFIHFLEAVHKNLGNAGEASETTVRVDANTQGTFITAWYNTAFIPGIANEKFTWIKRDGNLRLYAYHIESRALAIN